MALLINGISNLELSQIGGIIYGLDKIGVEKSSEKEQVEIWMGFLNETFVLSDFRLDRYFVRSLENYFIKDLFSKFNSKIEVLGFYDNDSDLPVGFSLFKENNLNKRLIRNDNLYLIEDYGPKSKAELEAINKVLPNYDDSRESVKQYLDREPELASQYSEDKPTLYIDNIVDNNLTNFTGKASCYFDFFYGIKGSKFFRDKELNLIKEDLLDMKGSYPYPTQKG